MCAHDFNVGVRVIVNAHLWAISRIICNVM